MDNAKGGVIQVNISLMNHFIGEGYEISILSIRHGDTWENITYPIEANCNVINPHDVWGCPLLSQALQALKKGRIFSCCKILMNRMKYKIVIYKDYQKAQSFILQTQPDVIIVSHYEILAAIPESYGKKTIMHFHTSFDQVNNNRSYRRIFQKYKNRIYCFVWLSKETARQAKKAGFDNSYAIYNPLTFIQNNYAKQSSKKCVFVGRMASEKRVWLAIKHFIHVYEGDSLLHDWTLDLYGDGAEAEEIRDLIKNYPYIHYHGYTNRVQEVLANSSLMLMTSAYEGMPLVVLEANECGVPVIAYDFGESSREVIIHEKSGIIISQDDEESYEKALSDLMHNEEKRIVLATYAKEFAKSFSMEHIGTQWKKLFSDIATNHPFIEQDEDIPF